MKILHTADWHIGQTFYNYDRSYEHQCFLDWLCNTLKERTVDVLLVSGDVFDIANPSASSIKMFYRFLSKAINENPDLQIIITAGNHDSPSRLESPKPLLESSNIHLIGLVTKKEDGQVDYEKLFLPLKNKSGETEAWCIAIPFLRLGDYPNMAGSEHAYTDGVAALYAEACQYATKYKKPHQPIIAMGHLHTQQATTTEADDAERPIMGGIECIPVSAFSPDLQYVALGHIHKAQCINEQKHIRYSGSPIALSFSEINYRHQVVLFELNKEEITNIEALKVPVVVPLQRVPDRSACLQKVLDELTKLPVDNGMQPEHKPFLEVRVLLDGPEPSLRHQIEKIIEGKYVRLARIITEYKYSPEPAGITSNKDLGELHPEEIFQTIFLNKYGTEVPEQMIQFFREITNQISVPE